MERTELLGLTTDDCRDLTALLQRLEGDAVRRSGGEKAAKRYGELAEKISYVQVGIVAIEQRKRAMIGMQRGG